MDETDQLAQGMVGPTVVLDPATFRVGEEYRLRFMQITRGVSVDIALTKNGADLPESLRLVGDAAIRTNTGETFDFLWTPTEPGEATLRVRYERFLEVAEIVLRQTLFLC